MPPSPVMRISPRRDLRAETHKRGRSLESGILFREKGDDDLALFNEVQSKERENFLLQSHDDFDDIFSTKLRHFSANALEVSIPARGESSDLLNAEGDKNDYDWLITPPETPLFSSLEDKAPPASIAPRGRPRSQPITISRSSTMEKGYRSNRSSASPHRLSPSPPSNSSTLQSRSRPFSATHSSPPPSRSRPFSATHSSPPPSRSRPFSATHSSPPPSRRLSPSPSKLTPAPRTSTPTPPRRMSTGSASSQSRARGPSPVKTSRGNSSSPKTRAWESNIPGFSSEAPPNLRTSLADRPGSYVRGSSPASRNGFRSGRQSMSPTASRSANSCLSQERDQFSSHSKGSVVSSGDDDVDSLQSNLASEECSVPRSVGAYPNSRTMGFSKKANKVLSSSVPKRSFDLALRQMERKVPQNMFRPLLSSVPSTSTTFYAGKEIAHHRALTSRNSSITTSSNASSDQGMSGALDTEESGQTHEDVTSNITKGQHQIPHDEIFVMDQTDAIENRILVKSPGCAHGENDEPSIVMSDVVLDRQPDTDGTTDMESCSICSRSFSSIKLIREGDTWMCLECKSTEINSTRIVPANSLMIDNNTTGDIVQILECGSSQISSTCETVKDHLYSVEDFAMSSIEETEPIFASEQEMNRSVGPSGVCSNIDASEGTGISLLLKRSSSGKGHIVQSRSFTASIISYDDFSYTRDSVNSMRSSIGHSSASVSSSVDLGYSKQAEARMHRQSSSLKSDVESYRQETPVKHRRSVSSLSGGASGQVLSTSSCHGDSVEVPAVTKEKAYEFSDAESMCIDIESSIMFKSTTDLSSRLISVYSEELAPPENGHDLTSISGHSVNEEISAGILISPRGDDDVMQRSCVEKVEDVSEIPQSSSLDAISEIEIENADIVSVDPHSDVDSTASKSYTDEITERSCSLPQNDAMTKAVEESDLSVPENCVHEESTIVLEDPGGAKPRSFTLEEATDAILFCSSIVHNIAYEAANIAIGKDNSTVEVLLPATTFVGKSNPDRRDMRSRATGRRISKSQKARQKKLDADTKPPLVVIEGDEKPTQRIVRSPSKVDSMHPPKLESKCNCTIM